MKELRTKTSRKVLEDFLSFFDLFSRTQQLKPGNTSKQLIISSNFKNGKIHSPKKD